MVREWFRVFWKRPSTKVIIGIIVALGIMSFLFSNGPIQYFASLLENPPDDIDVENTTRIVKESKALYHFFTYLYESPFSEFMVFLYLAFIGIFLSAQYFIDAQSGYGNFHISRVPYRVYSYKVIIAQSAYILAIMVVSYVLIFILHFIFSGFQLGVGNIGKQDISFLKGILVLIVQIINLGVYLILVNALCLQLSAFIRNRYLLHSLPLIIFGFVPLTITGTISKIDPAFGGSLVPIVPNYLNVSIKWFMISEDIGIVVRLGISYLVIAAIAVILRQINIRIYSENYLP